MAETVREEADRLMDNVVTGRWASVQLGRELRDAIEIALSAREAKGRADMREEAAKVCADRAAQATAGRLEICHRWREAEACAAAIRSIPTQGETK